MKLREFRLASGGDLYHPLLPVTVKFAKEEIELDGELDVIANEGNFCTLMDRKLLSYLAYQDSELGLRIIKLQGDTNDIS